VIRTHGDFHLGQTLYTPRGWVIIDFEGEPARPLSERRQKRSPLRDVASMLRSFAYATSALEILRGGLGAADFEQRARETFLEHYFDAVDSTLLPGGAAAVANLLSIFELEKAIYELQYELDNRPDWVVRSRSPGSCGCWSPHERSDRASSTPSSGASTRTRTPCSAPTRPTTAACRARAAPGGASVAVKLEDGGEHRRARADPSRRGVRGLIEGAELPLRYRLEVDYGPAAASPSTTPTRTRRRSASSTCT
jgi:hypothetical protein